MKSNKSKISGIKNQNIVVIYVSSIVFGDLFLNTKIAYKETAGHLFYFKK